MVKKQKRVLSKSERERRKNKIVAFCVMAVAAVFFGFPFLYMLGSSLKSDLDLQLHPELIFPSSFRRSARLSVIRAFLCTQARSQRCRWLF